MNIVSFSLFGSNPKYVVGMARNVALVQQYYPGWECHVWAERGHPAIVQLKQLGAAVTEMDPEPHCGGKWWRFFSASDTRVGPADVVVFRDADSRINVRELAAVNAWLASGRAGHIMRDHPHHAGHLILGGMWGVHGGVLKDMRSLCASWSGQRHSDMPFLAKHVYPLIDDWLQHGVGGLPWPPHEPYNSFVGEIYDQFDKPRGL